MSQAALIPARFLTSLEGTYDPVLTIKTMNVGDSGYVIHSVLNVDQHRRAWLQEAAAVYPAILSLYQGRRMPVMFRVQRITEGFVVFIPDGMTFTPSVAHWTVPVFMFGAV